MIKSRQGVPIWFAFDFDCTLIRFESLDELAKISLRDHTEKALTGKETKQIIECGMNGEISF